MIKKQIAILGLLILPGFCLSIAGAAEAVSVSPARMLFHFSLGDYPADTTGFLWPNDSPLATLKMENGKTRFFFNNQFSKYPGLGNKGLVPMPSSFDIYEGTVSKPLQTKRDDSAYLAKNGLGTVCSVPARYFDTIPEGGPGAPGLLTFRSRFSNIACDTSSDIQWVWLLNIFSAGGDTLLGFLHIETTPHGQPEEFPASYSIGLARSVDSGLSWRYLGEILKPKNQVISAGHASNIGGVPYLVVRSDGVDYIQVYYAEYDLCPLGPDSACVYQLPGCPSTPWPRVRNSVARARLDSVYAHAVAGNTGSGLWKKYDSAAGGWNQDGFTGLGQEILRAPLDSERVFGPMHGDAVQYKTPSGFRYLMVIPTNADCHIGWLPTLYTSPDGLHWTLEYTVPKIEGENMTQHPTFVSDTPVTVDGLVVDRGLNLFYSVAHPGHEDPSSAYYYTYRRRALYLPQRSPRP